MRGKASNNQRPTVTPTVTDSVKQETGSPEPPTETGLPEPPTYRAACALPGLPAASPIQTATADDETADDETAKKWQEVDKLSERLKRGAADNAGHTLDLTSVKVLVLVGCGYLLVIVGFIVYKAAFLTRPTCDDEATDDDHPVFALTSGYAHTCRKEDELWWEHWNQIYGEIWWGLVGIFSMPVSPVTAPSGLRSRVCGQICRKEDQLWWEHWNQIYGEIWWGLVGIFSMPVSPNIT